MFFTIEGIRKKPLSLQKQLFIQQIGMALLILLMVFAFYNDISRIFHRQSAIDNHNKVQIVPDTTGSRQ
jgi:regulator of sigma E protease